MKLLIDANVILDVFQAREPYVDAAKTIWKLCETRMLTGCVSALTFANIVYIMRKELEPQDLENVLRSLKLIFEFVDLSSSDISNAVFLKWDDFEDAVQSVTADRIGADYIITRNVVDFSESKVSACTPSEFIESIFSI